MKEDFNIPQILYLYDEGIKDLNYKRIKEFIKDNFGNIKICLIKLKKGAVQTKGLLFDFINTKKAFEALGYSKIKDSCHIILTNKLFATFDTDNRLHLRTSIYSYPSVISTSGIVEALAKPKDYYLYKQRYTSMGIWEMKEAEIKKKFKGCFIDYEDKRITEVLKGYIAQALFFYIMGKPFCQSKKCRLFNAHWQEDLIYSQIKIKRFCLKHQRLLRQIRIAVKNILKNRKNGKIHSCLNKLSS